MDEIMDCLKKANAQLEMARIYYKKIEDRAVFETKEGEEFKNCFGGAIKYGFLSQLALCIVVLQEELDKMNAEQKEQG